MEITIKISDTESDERIDANEVAFILGEATSTVMRELNKVRDNDIIIIVNGISIRNANRSLIGEVEINLDGVSKSK